MNDYYDQNNVRADHPTAKLVYSAMADMHEARSTFRYYQMFGDVPDRIHREFEARLVSFYDELKVYKMAAGETWDENRIDAIARISENLQSVSSNSGDSGALGSPLEADRVERVPIDENVLVGLSYKLDECANEIGFAADLGERDVQSAEPF